MASLALARAAAALPSVRARRLGSGRLPLAALPGRGAAGLAGTCRGGIMAVDFKVPKVPFLRCVCAASAGQQGNSDEHQLVHELKDRMKREAGVKLQVSDEEDFPRSKVYQFLFAVYVNKSFHLCIDVINHFKPASDSKLHESLKFCGETMIAAAASCGQFQAGWKTVSQVVEALDLLR